MREAMASEVRQSAIGGEGKKAEIDAGYFGGYVKPANRREDREIGARSSTSPASAKP